MNNKEYIAELARRSGYSPSQTQQFVKQVIDLMAVKFDEGESVFVSGFGTFDVKERAERIVVNPATGQRMLVPPKMVLSFKPVASVKDKLKKGGNEDE